MVLISDTIHRQATLLLISYPAGRNSLKARMRLQNRIIKTEEVRTRKGRDESLANDKVEQNVEKGLEGVAVEQDKAQGKKQENGAEAKATKQGLQNQIVRFGKPEPPISP
jgi:hypothetical protein